jgi:deazaflavin-dependent oxidoreductase (nitroreductase family)
MSGHDPLRPQEVLSPTISPVPSDLAFRLMNQTHRMLLRATGGRVGWYAPGYRMPVVQLTTTGRKSGQPRTTMLTSPYQEGSMLVLVASAGGNDRHPAWYLNVLSNPEVTVVLGGKPARRMRADTAGPEERARLWPIITRDHSNYAGYQKRTTREIPVVVLRPLDAGE